MIERNVTTTRNATLTIPEGEYDVHYELSGKCEYSPGRVSGPPEDCYPPEGGCEVMGVRLIKVLFDGEIIKPSLSIMSKLITELHKRSLDDFLYEDWQIAGPDDGPDE